MTITSALVAFLAGKTAAGIRVSPITLPPGDGLPAITYRLVGGLGPVTTHSDVQSVQAPRTRDAQVRLQLDAWGRTYLEAGSLVEELVQLMHGFRGTWGDVDVGSCLLEGDPIDDRDPDPDTYRFIADFMVRYVAGDVAGS